MRLYDFPHAPYSRKALFAAYEKGIELERVVTPPFDPAAKARLKALDPAATVPYLELDDGGAVADSSLIVEYFDLLRPNDGPTFVPRDPMVALRIRGLDRAADALLSHTAYLAWAPRKKDGPINEEKIASTRKSVDHTLARYDAMLAKNAFIAGDELTLADLGPLCAIGSLLLDGSIDDLKAWPKVEAWYERLVARPTWQRVLEDSKAVPLPY